MITLTIMVTAMDDAALYKLTAWLSPSYPVGAYTYSHGLEHAVEQGDVSDLPSLTGWVRDCLVLGAGRSDGILLAEAWRAVDTDCPNALEDVVELATALTPSAERRLETLAQGAAFVRTGRDVWPLPPDVAKALGNETPYPVAVGAWAAAHGCPLPQVLAMYLHAFAANIVSAGVRLIPLGQTDGQRAVAALFPAVEEAAADAIEAGIDDVGGCTLRADLASMHHETQYTRLFRS